MSENGPVCRKISELKSICHVTWVLFGLFAFGFPVSERISQLNQRNTNQQILNVIATFLLQVSVLQSGVSQLNVNLIVFIGMVHLEQTDFLQDLTSSAQMFSVSFHRFYGGCSRGFYCVEFPVMQ